MKFKDAKKFCDMGVLYWSDPDPIEDNDYKINSILRNSPVTAIIEYNDKESEAEVFLSELVVIADSLS